MGRRPLPRCRPKRSRQAAERQTTVKPIRRRRLREAVIYTLHEGVRRLRAEALPHDGLRNALDGVGTPQTQRMTRIVHRASVVRRGCRASIILAGLFAVLLGVPWWVYLRMGDAEPTVSIPTKVLPRINALYTWEKAWSVGYDLRNETLTNDTLYSETPDETKEQTSERTRILARNHETFDLIGKGLHEPLVLPRPSLLHGSGFDMSHIRGLAKLMILKARDLHFAKRDDSALFTGVDVMRMGSKVGSSGGTLDKMTGGLIESMGRRVAWQIVDHVSSAAAAVASRRIEELDKSRAPLSRSIREEMYGGQQDFVELLRGHDWRGKFRGATDSPYELYFTTKRRLVADYTRFMMVNIATADVLPPPNTPSPDNLRESMARVFAGWSNELTFREAGRNLVQNRLLMVKLALRAYRLEHGAYPKTLDNLVPRYLTRLPRDPFRPKQTFGYARTSGGHVLYSVGPDHQDQGGAALKTTGSEHSEKYPTVAMHSVGDIVAGVNRD